LLHRSIAILLRRNIMKTFEGVVFTATALGAQMLLIATLVAG
jgi:hypothetical protein